jgi:hypothetical protein
MRSVITIALLAFAVLVSACFSPNYGEGGFKCSNNTCPEGYTCVQEAASKVCRKKGAIPQPDRALDTTRPPDQRPGDRLTVVDVGPDQKIKVDGPKPDGVLPSCAIELVAGGNLLKNAQSFDLALDNSNIPHAVFVDVANKMLQHSARKGVNSWSPDPSNFTGADQVSAAISNDGGGDRLHIVYRAIDGTVARPWHTYRGITPLPASPWATPTVVDKTTLSNADISAYKSQVDIIGVSINLVGPTLGLWHLVWNSSSYAYNPFGLKPSDTIFDGRISVAGNTYTGFTYFRPTNPACWVVRREGPGSSVQLIPALGANASPAAVATQNNGQLHIALSRSSGQTGPLVYALWSGNTGDVPIEKELLSGNSVFVSSIDASLDVAGRPAISFLHQDGTVRLYANNGSTWTMVKVTQPGTPAGATTRVVVRANTAHVLFDSKNDLMYAACPLP